MKKSAHIAAAVVLAAGFFYFVTVQKDDAAMTDFKAKAAAFIRSGKLSAPVSEVLGKGGNRICIAEPTISTRTPRKVQDHLRVMFPARASAIEKLENRNNKAEVVIGIERGQDLIVMTGNEDIIVDGKAVMLRGFHNQKLVTEPGFRCFNYKAAAFSYASDSLNRVLYVGDPRGKMQAKPAAKKKPAAPEKKKPAPRSYGY